MCKMAKPITATPTIKGRAAEIIRREIEHGTPNTPERVQWIREADEVYRRATQPRSS